MPLYDLVRYAKSKGRSTESVLALLKGLLENDLLGASTWHRKGGKICSVETMARRLRQIGSQKITYKQVIVVLCNLLCAFGNSLATQVIVTVLSSLT